MKRLIAILVAMTVLTGCSELQVIGGAAMKEMQSEAINVEMASYKQTESSPVPPPRPRKKVYVAKAEYNPFVKPGQQMVAKNQIRGQWEKN